VAQTPRVSAILVNYNAGAELRHALDSIAAELKGQPWEAFVIDNASTDGSAATVLDFAPHATLVANKDNVGFARGVNQGLRLASAPMVLIINPDCRLVTGAVDRMVAELEAYPECALVGPKILNPDGSLQGSARGDPDMLTGLFGRTMLLRRLMPELPISKRNVLPVHRAADDGAGSIVADWVSGACMLARRPALLEVNGFDERYFLYWEDADLCRRLRHRGYHIRYVFDATAVHRVAHSSRRAQAAAIRAFHESAYLYYETHVAPGGSHREFGRRVRRRVKRLIARGILSARCYMHLKKAT
jgi:GT2 family glycosyltransferase